MPLRGKRARTGFSAPHPIDKKITNIQLNDVNATQQSTDLLTVSTACTVVGIRWSLFIEGDAGTLGNTHDYRWVIVHQRDGSNLSALGATNEGTLYSPEQNVLAFGVGNDRAVPVSTALHNGPFQWNGKTSSKRKLMDGDKIVFILDEIATDTVRCKGAVQLFCKF